MSRLNFRIEGKASNSQARAGRFRTLHNEVLTPLFMPVGTLATVRAQRTETLEESGSQILLANTYHLLQRPGLEVFEKFGGIHRFMKWDKSVLTDSGGYQIFSLDHRREIQEQGAWFRSTIDGKKIFLSPETSIAAQKAIGSDIMMVLDQCIDSTSSKEEAVRAMDLTHRWARRSLEARGDSPQALFGIVQGACFEDLRRESAENLRELPFDGFAIGGLAVGEERSERERICGATTIHMPEHLPRYMMGVGTPIDLLEAVHRGVDMFDCILPTAFAQQGMTFTSLGRLILTRGVYKFQTGPLDPNCGCPVCQKHDRAYLHHLIKTREILGWQLLGTHNLYFYHGLMRSIRAAILNDTFAEFYRHWREILPADDPENPVKHPRKVSGKRRIPPMELGDYRVYVSPQGHSNIQQISSGEIMHAVSAPEVEARSLYVEQTRLIEKLTVPISDPLADVPLVIWDVGLGAATNAMAVIRAIEAKARDLGVGLKLEGAVRTTRLRPVKLVSFERDLDSFKLAMQHPDRFPEQKHPAAFRLSALGFWQSTEPAIEWSLIEGDFFEKMHEAPRPDLILYDPFSFKVDAQLWSQECFEKILTIANSGEDARGAELYTYSSSTGVRGVLLSAGFYVARGVATGVKAETTIATSKLLPGFEYLGAEWLARWEKSGARIPALDPQVRAHAQFASGP